MDKSIRVRILDREFGLRVREEDEAITRDIAAHVDARMRAFKRSHPDQPELTVAIFTALALAEELYACSELQNRIMEATEGLFDELGDSLEIALDTPPPSVTDEPHPEAAEHSPPDRSE